MPGLNPGPDAERRREMRAEDLVMFRGANWFGAGITVGFLRLQDGMKS